MLSRVKLIAEARDAGGMYQVGSFRPIGAGQNGTGDTGTRFVRFKGGYWEAQGAAWASAVPEIYTGAIIRIMTEAMPGIIPV